MFESLLNQPPKSRGCKIRLLNYSGHEDGSTRRDRQAVHAWASELSPPCVCHDLCTGGYLVERMSVQSIMCEARASTSGKGRQYKR